MRVDVITLFPEVFTNLADLGVTGKALKDGVIHLHCWNPRDYALNRHRRVDDRPYGGGPGMLMAYQPLDATLAAVAQHSKRDIRLSLMSPQGQLLDQSLIDQLARREQLVLLCGRYEGIDERFIERHVDEEISLGNYVLSGGELAAAVIIDAVARLLPGVLGHEQSAAQDSFSAGLLDCPHYTRPESLDDGARVPDVLLSGDHQAIERWRRQQALGRTWERRPELLDKLELSENDQQLLDEYQSTIK